MNTVGVGSIVGQGLRLLILFTMFFVMLLFHEKGTLTWSYLVIYLLVILQFIYGFNKSLSPLISDLMEVSKVIFIILIIQAFINLFNQKKITIDTIEKIFKISVLLFPLLIIIPKVFGVGYSMYANNTGFSGFFSAANDLNVVLLVMLVFSLDAFFNNLETRKKRKYYIVTTFMLIFSLILMGSKSSMGIGSIIIFIYLFKFLIKSDFGTKLKVLLSLIVVGSVSYTIINNFYYNDVQLALDRHTYFLNTADGDLASFLLTNRNSFFDASVQNLKSSDSILGETLIGKGKTQHMKDTGGSLNFESKDIEMDLFDVFFSYGLLGVFLIYSYFSGFIILAFKSINGNFKYSFSLLVMAAYSFFGGHVLFSALSGTFLALLCCGLYASFAACKEESLLNRKEVGTNKNVHIGNVM